MGFLFLILYPGSLPRSPPPPLTYNNFTHTNLIYNNFTHTHTHTTLTYNNFTNTQNFVAYYHSHTELCRIPSLTYYNFTVTYPCVAGMALMALGGALGLGLVARDAAALCVAGAAQTHIYRRFPWQSWHKLTSTFFLRGRRGTNSHLPSFCVAAVAQTHIYHRLAWQAWH